MKIEKIIIQGIKSHKKTPFTVENYNTFVGENNTGKSNILFAIMWFFNEIKLKYENVTHNYLEDPSVIIKFKLDTNEEPPLSIEKKDLQNNCFEVKAYCKLDDLKNKVQPPKYQIIAEGIKPKDLKQKIKFGEIIFVPSIRELSDELKFTANSTINRLVSKFVVDRIKNEDGKAQKYKKVNEAIKELSNYIKTGEQSAFGQLKTILKKNMLDYKNISIGFKLEPPSIEELIKNSFKPSVNTPTGETSLDSQGMGFQRSLIFSLICAVNELEDNSDILTIYLIEEPELFLHPNHQISFRTNLMNISNKVNNQVLLTSHSPYFVNNIEDYSQIKRISLIDNKSQLKEITQDEIKNICRENGQLMANAKNEAQTTKWDTEELKKIAEQIANEDELRYLLWVDPERANSFLSKKVILVEGRTEKAFFSYLLNNSKGPFFGQSNISNICIVDVNGKFHFYKFANLLKKLGIPCWILYDGDKDKNKDGISHKKLNEYIEEMKSKKTIIDCLKMDPDLEVCLGFKKDGHKPDIAMYYNLLNNYQNYNEKDNYKQIIRFIEGVISYNET